MEKRGERRGDQTLPVRQRFALGCEHPAAGRKEKKKEVWVFHYAVREGKKKKGKSRLNVEG